MKKNKLAFFMFSFVLVFTFSAISFTIKSDYRNQKYHSLRIDNVHQKAGYAETVFSRKNKRAAADSYLECLSETERLCQLFLVSVVGRTEYSPIEMFENPVTKEKEYLVPGGVLLFSYNLGAGAEDMMKLTDSVADYSMDSSYPRPYIAVDQEGGTVCRLRNISSRLPDEQSVAAKLDVQKAYELYLEQGRQLYSMGINMNLAPVAEASAGYNKDFLEDRTFGGVAESVVYSYAAVNAYRKGGVACVLKHFPGNTNTDPHSGLPEIELTADEIYSSCISPFYFMLRSEPAAVLMSHARTKNLDGEIPSCLSRIWVNDVLKGEMGFGGLVISDDIFMGALRDNGFDTQKASVMAINAGVHVIMISEKYFGDILSVLVEEKERDAGFSRKLDSAVRKVIDFKVEQGIMSYEVSSDGKLVLVNTSPESQYGSREIRLDNFNDAYRKGSDIIRNFYEAKK